MKVNMIEYTIGYDGLNLSWMEWHSDWVEEMFYNGTLFRDVSVDMEQHGRYRLYFKYDDDGNITVFRKEYKIGWVEEDIW